MSDRTVTVAVKPDEGLASLAEAPEVFAALLEMIWVKEVPTEEL